MGHSLRTLLRYVLAGVIVCRVAASAVDAAQSQPQQLTVRDLFELFAEERTVITAALHEQTRGEAIFSTTILTREDIKAMGVTSTTMLLTEIFKTTPGLYAPTVAPRGTLVKVRGNGSAIACSVKILLNGTDASDTIVHGLELISLPISIDEIERIEIVRGPGSVLHGPAATQGVINIITKVPRGNEGTRVVAGQGGDNTVLSLTHSASREGLAYSFHAGGNRQESFMDRGRDGDLRNASARFYLKKDLAGNSRGVSLDSSVTTGDKADYQLFFGVNRISRWRGALDFRYTMPRLTFKSNYRVTHRASTPVADLVANPPDLIRARFDSLDQVAEQELTANLDPIRRLHTVVGGGYRYENVDWDLLDGGRQDQHKFYGYTNNEYLVAEPLTAVLGIRVDNSDFTPAELSGNAGVVYRPRPAHTIRVLAGISVFDPPYKIAFINTGNLRPVRHMLREKNRSAELGYQGQLGGRVKLEGVVYRIIGYDHFGVAPPRAGVRIGFNRPLHSAIWGAETVLDVLITRQITAWANYTIAKPKFLRTPNPVDRTWPRNMANGGVKALFGKTLTHVWFNYADSLVPSGGTPAPVPAHTLVNATFSYDATPRVGLFFSGYNLANDRVREDNVYSEVRGRIVTAGIRTLF